ncbi:DMT family transporter [Granulosicoccaceae sp. 1_MG-2023]|nr:DMT family transporter [Granulosicoccaceae sp. 1_MG-2023]
MSESGSEEYGMAERKAPDQLAFVLMLFFCLMLALQQVVLKAAADDVAPILQLSIRSLIGAVLVGLFMYARRETVDLRTGNWKPGLLAGLLFMLEYLTLGEALRLTSASHAVVFLYTSPVFAALILHFMLPSERMGALQWLGITLAFGGTALAFLPAGAGPQGGDAGAVLLGDALALMAGASWGLTTVLIRTSRLASVSPRETLLYQLLVAFVLLLAAAMLSGQMAFNPTPLALGSIAFQSVFICFLALMVWFWLLRHYHASPIGVMSYLTPVLGVLLGVWLLGEPLEAAFVAGSVMVIGGVLLVIGAPGIRRWSARLRRGGAF